MLRMPVFVSAGGTIGNVLASLIEDELRSDEAVLFIIDENGSILLKATGDDSRTYEDFPSAAACIVAGYEGRPLLLHRRDPLPTPLIRAAVGCGWEIEPFPGWDKTSLRPASVASPVQGCGSSPHAGQLRAGSRSA